MPFLNNENKPPFLNRPSPGMPKTSQPRVNPAPGTGPKKDGSRAQAPGQKKDGFAIGGSQGSVSRYDLKRSLEKNQVIREKLARELQLKPYSPEMDKAIKDMEEGIPQSFGSYIDQQEVERLSEKQHQIERREANKMAGGGITYDEIKELQRSKTKASFLRRLFGLGKK